MPTASEGGHKCPECGDGFSTDHGLKTHHGMKHGGELSYVTVTCSGCGDETRKRECLISDDPPHFCDNACKGEYQSRFADELEWSLGNWGPATVECEYCGEEFERYNYRREGEREFCNHECYGKWISENRVGENHPNWKGGAIDFYGESWTKQRRRALERDEYLCRVCGISSDEHRRQSGQTLDVHHITPFRDYGVEDHIEANRLDNLITLCRSCHQKVEAGSLTIS